MICLGVNGCSWQHNSDAKAVWTSASADPKEKVQAATALIPKHASPKEVREILGPSATWNRYHGYSQDLYAAWTQSYGSSTNIQRQASHSTANGAGSSFYDLYYLEYPATNGYIAIEFERIGSTNGLSDYQFKRACYMLTNLPGNVSFESESPK